MYGRVHVGCAAEWTFLTEVRDAETLVDEFATPHLKLALDTYHFGFDESLNIAAQTALNDMLGLMAEKYNITRADAKALASLVVDMRITQIANKVFGVHAVLPHDAIEI